MKPFYLLFCIAITSSVFAQKSQYNTNKGYVAEGYDLVSYFQQKAEKGDKKFTTSYDGVQFKFASKAHLEAFQKAPEQYVPQYGGYCAYAIGLKGKKVGINPKTFEIREGKLYLFYNSWGTNTLDLWNEEGAEKLQKQADINWQKIIED
ncbi:YHS domain-containing (seleno)protein [Polaribacter sp. HL-MS24]|uniref:YHS domain-containing (seleno)protein n=1 Tax=Polaribacter sp. HL-MS24 TaxID=3077735 RepID=UPI0029350AA1|nr:YHS domain-containing (seleno)protein [Polaribacter sp. HL-MS24]WOC41122.1 YHS domain-containing (seleno)protein [Polaribacter sp. HL-MS24]